MNETSHHTPLLPALYVVATPIGNLGDITLRALDILQRVDRVAAEDTRVSGQLLAHFNISKPLVSVREHNERKAAEGVVARIVAGDAVAYVSDAGTPAVSDPGARLVAVAAAVGHRVVPIPGPSSALAALSVAGDVQGAGFRCVGFLPAKGSERRAALEALARVWAHETANMALRVNLFNPGPVRTRMRAILMPGEDPLTLDTPEQIAEAVVPLCLPSWTETGKLYDYKSGKTLSFQPPA